MGGLRRQVAYVQKYRQRCGHSCKDTDKARGILVEIQTQVEEGGERHDIRAGGAERLSLSDTPCQRALKLPVYAALSHY